MKRLVKKIPVILKDQSGETLIEGLASILVFTVLIATITMMLLVSLRITNNTTIAAENMQEAAAAVLAGDEDEADANNGNFIFQVVDDLDVLIPPVQPVQFAVTVYNTDGFIAFEQAAP